MGRLINSDTITVKRAGIALRAALSLGLLVALWIIVDGPAAIARLRGADFGLLLWAFAVLNLQTVISAWRWQITASRLGQGFGLLRAIREYYLAQFLNQTLPGGMVGDAGRAVRARHDGGLAKAGQAVVLERMAGQVMLAVIMLTAMALTALMPGGVNWPRWAGYLSLSVLGAMICVPGAIWLLCRVPGRIGTSVRHFADSTFHALLHRQVRTRQVLLSFGTVACNLTAFALCARATGSDLPMLAILSVVPVVLLAMLMPLSVGGWGLREGVAAALWPLMGGTAEAGLAASVAFGLTFIAASLPGAIPLMIETGLLRRSAAQGDVVPQTRPQRPSRLPRFRPWLGLKGKQEKG